MSGGLERYRSKRDFERTPEPRGGKGGGRASRPDRKPGHGRQERREEAVFVVHRHEARRLHYDLRLEAGGTLKCWAVPKGFSYAPRDKRLAVRTEDHPLEYTGFSGIIPKGQYGAGTMIIWDRGAYALAGASLAAGLEKGELKLVLHGFRLRGEWHMVRTGGEPEEWLLFKARDRFAREDGKLPPVDPAGARRAPWPARPRLMQAQSAERPFSDPGWVFEMGFRGMRLLLGTTGGRTAAWGSSGRRLTLEAPGIQTALGRLRAEHALLDGVLVAVDGGGRPSRDRLEALLAEGRFEGISYYAFDLLHLDGWDLRPLPLLSRKALLAWTLPDSGPLLYVDHVAAEGERLAAAISAGGLGWLIAKKAGSPYRAGATGLWLEIPVSPAAGSRREALGEALKRSGRSVSARDPRVRLSNPDKVFWPRQGYTKADLLAWYEEVSGLLLPHLAERPVHMLRYPEGIGGKSFYQRQAPQHLPAWIPTVPIDTDEGTVPHILCNERSALLYLVNLGSIDLHPWLSRRESLDSPDWAVLDLDAKESDFATAVLVAREAGKLLRGVGLRPYLKTSGASGLHVYLPLAPGYGYDQSRLFCETVARLLAGEHPQRATVERNPAHRRGRVYLDFLQNRRSQTVVPPYAVRPLDGAPVSMPLEWDELDRDLRPGLFTIKSAGARLRERGDLFAPVLTDRQRLEPAIRGLEEYIRSR